MQRNIFKTSTICLSFLIIFTNNTSEVNNNYFITILKKITSKGDFTAKILDIASIIKTKNEEEINLESIKQFTESDRGKKLNNAFNNALDQNFQQQSAISKIGHFLYDFYQSNIFGNQTKNIGKILEFYLLTFHKITVAINFDTIKSSKDLILRHRLLFEQKIIDDALYTLIKTVNLIRYAPLEKLTDIDYLENKLLLELGLNNANLHEFPSHLTEHYGKGLKYW
ncbi:hypothetical protein HYV10_03700 [Candidatus Dependentiae bacterium]|nr:hypothetical protein [Candidatus Dependentiae bacterium]